MATTERTKKAQNKTKQNSKKSDDNSIIINQIKTGQLHRHIEDIQSWQIALRNAESVLNPRRVKLYEIYNNITIDGHLDSIMNKRVRAVKTSPLAVENIKSEGVREQIQSPWFFEMMDQMMRARFWGHTLLDLLIENGDIKGVELVPRQNVMPEYARVVPQMYGNPHGADAIDYTAPEYQDRTLEFGDRKGLGILAKAAPYVLYKRGNLADFAQFNELFGQPIREYKYNPHDPESRKQTEEAAEKMGASAYIVVPEGTSLELHESNQTGASETFSKFHEILNKEMSILVLGQSLTTDSNDKGSYALGNVHKAVEEGVNLEDKLWAEYELNWNVKPKLAAHGLNITEPLKFDDTAKLPKDKLVDVYMKLAKLIPFDPQFLYDEFDIEPPAEGQGVKLQTQSPFDQGGENAGGEETGADESKNSDANLRAIINNLSHPVRRNVRLASEPAGGGALHEQLEALYTEGCCAELATKYNDYPMQARKHAEEALKYARENESTCGTGPGWQIAKTLAEGKALTWAGVTRMYRYKSHKKDKSIAYKDGCGGLMWDAHGGDAGIAWAESKVLQNLRTAQSTYDLADNNDELEAAFDEMARKVYEGELEAGQVDEGLYQEIAQRLYNAVEAGFGAGIANLDTDTPDYTMLNNLRHNIHIFSGFKTYQELLEVSRMMVDEEGNLKAWKQFKEEVTQIHETYNVNYLATEYDQATANSQNARDWLDYTKQGMDKLVEYDANLDDQTTRLCRRLDGIILPLNHSFWDRYWPGNHWKCRSRARVLNNGTRTREDQIQDIPDQNPTFAFNPGKQEVVFPKNHPYYQVQKGDEGAAGKNFGLEIPGDE